MIIVTIDSDENEKTWRATHFSLKSGAYTIIDDMGNLLTGHILATPSINIREEEKDTGEE